MVTDFIYTDKVILRMQKNIVAQKDKILEAAKWFSETIINDKLIHVFGAGHSHMIGLELYIRAGGLANVNAMLDPDVLTSNGANRSGKLERLSGIADVIWEDHVIKTGDIILIVSNSGRNALPIEMALRAKKEGIKAIALTSLEQSGKQPSRHSNGKKLMDIADLVIDNGVPNGDGIMQIDGITVGAVSSVSGILLANTIATEAMQMVVAAGHKSPIYTSQNIDGYNNDDLYARYKGRVKYI